MSRFAAPIAEQIWDMKYRFKDAEGKALDTTVEDTWRRIARALASVEKDKAKWEDKFYSALEDFKYLPAGRITAGAGTARSVTLFNCFVMGTVPDSMGGIFDMLKEAALTMQQGGGIGYDFSTIRPKGALVHGVAADASGPLSFMDVWDAMCRTIMSAGARRGAMMGTMRCDHPDIEDFIAAKADANRLRNFNLSVLVTDAFMAAISRPGRGGSRRPWPGSADGAGRRPRRRARPRTGRGRLHRRNREPRHASLDARHSPSLAGRRSRPQAEASAASPGTGSPGFQPAAASPPTRARTSSRRS